MKQFPTDIKFKYPWRSYQQRVLQELESHLNDNHLHIIAPPGSGKTILGIEVALRLNKPTLILAPTIAIRNQWIQRFCELFLRTKSTPNWISINIKEPKFLTVSTYQGLHAACSGKTIENKDYKIAEESSHDDLQFSNTAAKTIIEGLKKEKISTIVVDEAHHLKNAWWKSLTEVKKNLEPTIVGLTATPPYDVSYNEWQRYIELNGPVDAEISVPELVLENDLCPHQDYIMFSYPTPEEGSKIKEYNNNTQQLFTQIKADTILKSKLLALRCYIQPLQELEWIYSNIENYAAILIYLNAVGVEISPLHLDVIGDKNFKIPELNYEWIETLLTFYIYHTDEDKEYRELLLNKLKRNGVVNRKKISFAQHQKRNKLLSSSISKLESIKEIVDFESLSLGNDLRMVILTDYIRKELLVSTPKNTLPLTSIGVIPIFEKLRRTKNLSSKVGVLTGSIIIIPFTALNQLDYYCKLYKIDTIATTPLSYDPNFLVIKTSERLKQNIVHIITQLFQEGHIEILIGTKSLLGEGWDAPAINALILASFVGSYVLSNQMRGRAIRTQKSNPLKTGNIWHLVCVDVLDNDGGVDYSLLKRRFKAFVGVSLDSNPRIENGIDRLHLPTSFTTAKQIFDVNQKMFACAHNRNQLELSWKKALEEGITLIEEIKVPFPSQQNYKQVTSLYFNKTIANLSAFLVSGIATFGETILEIALRNINRIKTLEHLLSFVTVAGIAGLAIFGRLFYRTSSLYLKHRDISKDIKGIGEALLASLINNHVIKTPREKLVVLTSQDEYGAVFCHLEGASTFEKSVFITSLSEIIDTIDNPRYVIIRKATLFNLIDQKDFHAVPELLGKQKSLATNFESNWKSYVGKCKLVFTRNIEGRKILLKSRIHSLAASFQDKSERVNTWK